MTERADRTGPGTSAPTASELSIGWAGQGGLAPAAGPAWNRVHGGPDALLLWLESQLGLTAPTPPWTGRVTEYAALLESVDEAGWTASLGVDRWSTAADLLRRRDALRLAGWDGAASPPLPPLVRDLARAESGARHVRHGTAERLEAVCSALDGGLALPPHEVVLAEPPSWWPPRWRQVLKRLEVRVADAPPVAQAPAGTSLGSVQRGLAKDGAPHVMGDASLRWIAAESRLAAAEAVAGMLVALESERHGVEDTVVLCEDARVAVLLDRCLAAHGIPTSGGARVTNAAPALQILPLAIHLCWEPVDPETLLQFVSLPLGPVPRSAGRTLAAALARQPGLGSRAWESAVAELTSPERDPEGKLAARLARWLDHPRTPRGQALPASLVGARCRLLAQWAVGRAEATSADASAEDVEGLRALAGQAAALGELAASHGGPVTEPQLARLLEAVRGDGVLAGPGIAAAGGPFLATSLAQVTRPVGRLIWLGLSTGDLAEAAWTARELEALGEAGVDLDDGTRALRCRRRAERRGLRQIRERLLAVGLPGDAETRPHPVWQQIADRLRDADGGAMRGTPLGRTIAAGDASAVAPWALPTTSCEILPPPPERPLWTVAPDALTDRLTSSASSLEDRLACPLKWTLHYRARLRPSDAAELPGEFQLRGSFCHEVLAEVFGHEGTCPSVDDAVAQAGRVFDERIGLDAAPLAQPARLVDRRGVRAELMAATRVLVEALERGAYRLVGAEVPVKGEVEGRVLRGAIDCLVRREDGAEAVVDFKYGGTSKYPRLLAAGRAIQLATYATARRQEGGAPDVRVAYLLLADGSVHTPDGSPLVGATPRELVPDAAPIDDVWRRFIDALRAADGWLAGEEPVPARPLQPPEAWPPGSEMVLEARAKMQAVCRYCDFGVICGREGLE